MYLLRNGKPIFIEVVSAIASSREGSMSNLLSLCARSQTPETERTADQASKGYATSAYIGTYLYSA